MDTKKNYLVHHGILGQKWGIRRYQNPDGTWTDEGKRRRSSGISSDRSSVVKALKYPKRTALDAIGSSAGRNNRYYKKLDKRASNVKNIFAKNERLKDIYTKYKNDRMKLSNKQKELYDDLEKTKDQIYDDFEQLSLEKKKQYYKPFFDSANKAQGIPTSVKDIEKMSDSDIDNICYNVLGFNKVENSRKTLTSYIQDEYNLHPWDDIMEDIWSGAFYAGQLPTDLYYADNKKKYGSINETVQKIKEINSNKLSIDREFTESVLGDLKDLPITQVLANGNTINTVLSDDLLKTLSY